MEITIPYQFTPRPYQVPLMKFADSGGKRAVCVWHRRAGKEKTLINIMCKKMLERVGMYYYFFPTYAQGKKILWDGMDRDGFKFTDHIPKEIRLRTDNSEMKIELKNGSIFQVIGTDKIDSIVGTNPVGCVFSEYSLQNPQAWTFIRPILRENKGWAIFNYTPRGKNHGHKLYQMAKDNENWFCQLLTINDTVKHDGKPVITDQDIIDERREGMEEEMIEQEYYCSFHAAIPGSYYGSVILQAENEKRIRKGIEYDPKLPVHTAWDIGHSDSTSIILFQLLGKEIRIFDYIEASGHGVEYYVNELISRGFRFGNNYVPHDFYAKEYSSGKSSHEVAVEVSNQAGADMKFVQAKRIKSTERGEVNEGISSVRRLFPRVWIDEEKCEHLIDALKSYHQEYDDKKQDYKGHPYHDWSSHAADAMRYLAVSITEDIPKEVKEAAQQRRLKKSQRFRGHH